MRTYLNKFVVALVVGATQVMAHSEMSEWNYAEARNVWERSRIEAGYQEYLSEFVQFNNHFHIDEKSGCYEVGSGSVRLMLVITQSGGNRYAVIERAFSDVETAKAHCFEKAYVGLETRIPPYVPFVLQLDLR